MVQSFRPCRRCAERSAQTPIVVVLAALALLAPAAAPASGIEGARAALEAMQRPDGTFPGAPVVDSAAVIDTLPPGQVRAWAQFGLSQARPDNLEAALEQLRVLQGSPFEDQLARSAVRALLLDGRMGLPLWAGGADPLVLAKVLEFARATQDDLVAEVALSRLPALQRDDGGFGFADNASDISLTAEVARALGGWPAAVQPANVRPRAVTWLLQRLAGRAQLSDADLALLILGLAADLPGSMDALSDELLARHS